MLLRAFAQARVLTCAGVLRSAARSVAPQRPLHITHAFNVSTFHHRDVSLVSCEHARVPVHCSPPDTLCLSGSVVFCLFLSQANFAMVDTFPNWPGYHDLGACPSLARALLLFT